MPATEGGLPTSDVAGSWAGVHVLSVDRLLLFANNSTHDRSERTLGGTGDGSFAIELALDRIASRASRVWSYATSIQNDAMGDVQRLPNGNTVVAYSAKGVLHEVAPDGALLQEWSFSGGASFGYIEKRASLYGPPPR